MHRRQWKLTNIIFYYNYSSIIIINSDDELGRALIIEFKEVDNIEQNIIICLILHKYLFVLSYEGKFIFYNELNPSPLTDRFYSISPYKFEESKLEYYYTISFVYEGQLNILYNKINLQKSSNDIINKIQYRPFFMKEDNDPWLQRDSGNTCELLSEFSYNVISCFFVSQSNNKYFTYVSFLPDENFTVISNYTYLLNNTDIGNIKHIKSSTYNKIEVLICLLTTTESFCMVYNTTDHSLSEKISKVNDCSDKLYSTNIYFFQKKNEFIFSCISNQNFIRILPISKEFTYVESDNYLLNYIFDDCSSPFAFSIIYISPLKIYSLVIELVCSFNHILFDYLLIKNSSQCDNFLKKIKEDSDIKDIETNNDEEYSKKSEIYFINSSQIAEPNKKTQYFLDIESTKTSELNKITDSIQKNENFKSNLNSENLKSIETTQIIQTSQIDESFNNIQSSEETELNKEDDTTKIIESSLIIETSQINNISNEITETNYNSESKEAKFSMITNDFSQKSSQISDNLYSHQTNDLSNISEEYQMDDSSSFTEKYKINDSSQKSDFSSINENYFINDSSQINNFSSISENYQINNYSQNRDTLQISDSLNIIDKSTNLPTSQIDFSSKIIESSLITEDFLIKESSKIIPSEISKLIENSESFKENENIIICDEKCDKCNEESKLNNLCIKCNNKKKYYEIKLDNELNNKEKYIECYTEGTKPPNYFLNNNIFESCFYTCGICNEKGNEEDHKCLTCADNYIQDPNKNKNCILKCKYYFYFSDYGEYKCTNDNQCPEEASFFIPDLLKCTNNCKNELNFKYQYNGQCINECPEDTELNKENNICEIKNKDSCSYSLFNLFLENDIQKNNIGKIAKDYAKEYYYTNNHISNYISNKYSIIIYKNSDCIKKLKLNLPTINFGDCYQKVKDFYSIKKDLIIGVIDSFSNDNSGNNNPETTYALFHPETGKNLNASEICKEIKVIVEENILSIIDDNKTVLFFADQNVNIFNISNEFYTDICFHFESPNKKDIVLKDRIQSFYPNVTLCDSGCKNIGINFTSFVAICECSFKDLLDINFLKNNILAENIIINEILNQVKSIIILLNLEVMRCYKTIFNIKYFLKCTGGFIVLTILILEFSCILIYINYSLKETIGFLFRASRNYIEFIGKTNKKMKVNYISTKKNNNFPPKNKKKFYIFGSSKKNKKILKKKNAKKNDLTKRNTTKNVHININMAEFNFNSRDKNPNALMLIKNKFNKNYSQKEFQILNRNNKSNKKLKSISFSKNSNTDKSQFFEKSSFFKMKNGFNIEEYISNNYEEMDYEDAIIDEKRSFCRYFIERIKTRHILINIFFNSDHIKPKSIKILLFLTQIDLYLLINAMLFNEEYISEIYHNENNFDFISYINSSINRYIYTTSAGTIINYLIKCFFIREKKFKRILIRAEDNTLLLNNELFLFTEKLKKMHIYFIITSITICLFSWYYISCFNNIYQYTKNEWLLSSFFFIFITQILHALSTFLETFFRYLSFKFESDKIYKFSLLFAFIE